MQSPSEEIEAFRGLPLEKRPRYPTVLESWLKKHGWDMGAFARRIGVNKKMVMYWAHGKCVPGLIHAYAIEKATKGEVFVASWLSTEIGKLLWNQLNMKQDAKARKGKARASRLPASDKPLELEALQGVRQDETSSNASSEAIAEIQAVEAVVES